MKHLLAPAFAVIFSTAGVLYGCHAAGMSPRDITIAGLLAFGVSLAAASAAVALSAARSHRPPVRQSVPHHR